MSRVSVTLACCRSSCDTEAETVSGPAKIAFSSFNTRCGPLHEGIDDLPLIRLNVFFIEIARVRIHQLVRDLLVHDLLSVRHVMYACGTHHARATRLALGGLAQESPQAVVEGLRNLLAPFRRTPAVAPEEFNHRFRLHPRRLSQDAARDVHDVQ